MKKLFLVFVFVFLSAVVSAGCNQRVPEVRYCDNYFYHKDGYKAVNYTCTGNGTTIWWAKSPLINCLSGECENGNEVIGNNLVYYIDNSSSYLYVTCVETRFLAGQNQYREFKSAYSNKVVSGVPAPKEMNYRGYGTLPKVDGKVSFFVRIKDFFNSLFRRFK